jgi:Flp pilus assembly protein TadD
MLLKGGDGAGARAAIDDALRLAPTNPQLIEDRIAIDVKLDGVDAALAQAKAYSAQHPELTTADALEGDAYIGAGQADKALEAYRQAYQRKPSGLLAMRLYRALVAGGKPQDGAQILRDWLAGHPDDLAAAAQLGTADIFAHRYDEARKELEAVAAKRPQDPILLNNLAWLYHLTGDPRAQPVAQQAYMLAPNVGEIAATLGWILTKAGHGSDAVGLLQQATATEPSKPAIKYHLAVALNDAGQPQAARKILSSLMTEKIDFDDKSAAEQLLAELSKRQ